jgi:phosphoenolpyruvate carboxylase
MSVLAIDRKESKLEAITFSAEVHNMLIELMQRSFGVKNTERLVRKRYACGDDVSEYRYLLRNVKNRLDETASLLTNNLRAANSIYPTSMYEYDQRRGFQNIAIANCEQLIKELQRVVEVFEVDVNVYGTCIKAIDREIRLIKKWRQGDNKIKSYLQG